MLPLAREHNFYKTRIFDFIAKMGSKILVFQIPIPLKIEENGRQKRSLQTKPFVTPFLFIFDCILASNLRSKKRIFFKYFSSMASRGTQEGPRGLQEPILRAFGLHFGRLDGPRVRPRGSQGVPRESQASPGAIQEKILKEFDVGKVFGCNLCTYG